MFCIFTRRNSWIHYVASSPMIPVSHSVCDVVVLAHPTSRSLLVRYTPLGLPLRRRCVYKDPSCPSSHFCVPTLHTFLFALLPRPHIWRQIPSYLRQPPSKILVS